MQRNVVILDIDYVTYEDRPVIRLFSKEGDKNIVLIDDTFEPYLYVVSDDVEECMAEIEENIDVVNIERVIKKDFQIESEFIKVTFKHPQELAKKRGHPRMPSEWISLFFSWRECQRPRHPAEPRP